MKSPIFILAVLVAAVAHGATTQPTHPDAVDRVSAKLRPTRTVVYKKVADRELKLHIFEPYGHKATDRRACFVSIHGGGWSGGTPNRMYPFVADAANLGLLGISIEYRLANSKTKLTPYHCVQDARSALRFIRAHAAELGIDPDRIVAHGGSAGGHLAAATAMFGPDEPGEDTSVSCVPNALVLLFPVIDTSKEGYGFSRLGERWQEISPLHQVRPNLPPTLIFHGTGDTVTPFKGAQAFHDAMLKAKNRCELVVHEGGVHGYLMRDSVLLDQTLVRTARFLASLKYLAPAVNSCTADWQPQADADAKLDYTTVAYDGIKPNSMVCDTTVRELPDGSWILFILAGGDTEPSPKNYIGISRSSDRGRTWTPLQAFDCGLPREGNTIGQCVTEAMIHQGRCTLFFSTHAKTWAYNWKSWMIHSDDSCRTWSKPQPVPGRLANFTFVRNHIVTRDGRILVPFQHYVEQAPCTDLSEKRSLCNPRNGVLMSSDGGKTWTEYGDIRLSSDDKYFSWAENNLAELADGRVAMIIRAAGPGVLYYAESTDSGRTWPAYAARTDVPNSSSKATLYSLGGDIVAMLHSPNPTHRSPLALWISFDGMKTWPYRRVLVPQSSDGPRQAVNYPDGFVSKDKQYLYFAYDDARHRAVFYAAKLPPLTARSPKPANGAE